ncbi:hypothetical protein [Paracoccus laeviglucosivorans]|uniref:Uncharacterized protein n=1 Tax=Paracoccus laeviglucosivorans TaxID=1197861 RepID=A0A521D2A7_9RHOB|nr:hypothetical protein [Paracoccus laeviglucosivorans]SMO65823.1 hypothetical protein SAMN06265221_1066 [Paracoccus laeviglucosivorans]
MAQDGDSLQDHANRLIGLPDFGKDGFPAALVISGPRGCATLRIDAALTFDEPPRKAVLMARALGAEHCALLFPSHLRFAGSTGFACLVAVSVDAAGSQMTLFARRQGVAHPLRSGLVGTAPPAGSVAALSSLVAVETSDEDVQRAWQQLEAMGVSIAASGRVLH